MHNKSKQKQLLRNGKATIKRKQKRRRDRNREYVMMSDVKRRPHRGGLQGFVVSVPRLSFVASCYVFL